MCNNIVSQETSGGLPAAGTNWKSQTFSWTKIKQKHEHCLTELRCCSTILPILFSINKILPKLKVVPGVADLQCEIVLRTWPLECYCAGDAIHPVLQKGVVWFSWLLYSLVLDVDINTYYNTCTCMYPHAIKSGNETNGRLWYEMYYLYWTKFHKAQLAIIWLHVYCIPLHNRKIINFAVIKGCYAILEHSE